MHKLLVMTKDGERIVPPTCLPRRDEPAPNQLGAFGSGDVLDGVDGLAYRPRQRLGTVKPGLTGVVRPDRPNVEQHAQNQRHGDRRPDADIPPRAAHRRPSRRGEFVGHGPQHVVAEVGRRAAWREAFEYALDIVFHGSCFVSVRRKCFRAVRYRVATVPWGVPVTSAISRKVSPA